MKTGGWGGERFYLLAPKGTLIRVFRKASLHASFDVTSTLNSEEKHLS